MVSEPEIEYWSRWGYDGEAITQELKEGIYRVRVSLYRSAEYPERATYYDIRVEAQDTPRAVDEALDTFEEMNPRLTEDNE